MNVNNSPKYEELCFAGTMTQNVIDMKPIVYCNLTSANDCKPFHTVAIQFPLKTWTLDDHRGSMQTTLTTDLYRLMESTSNKQKNSTNHCGYEQLLAISISYPQHMMVSGQSPPSSDLPTNNEHTVSVRDIPISFSPGWTNYLLG